MSTTLPKCTRLDDELFIMDHEWGAWGKTYFEDWERTGLAGEKTRFRPLIQSRTCTHCKIAERREVRTAFL
jgi:hypothetical protein